MFLEFNLIWIFFTISRICLCIFTKLIYKNSFVNIFVGKKAINNKMYESCEACEVVKEVINPLI